MAKVYGSTEQEVDTNVTPLKRSQFNVKNLSKMMTILRDGLYKHKERTLVQEYICNARDAVREKYKLELLKKDPSLDPKLYLKDEDKRKEAEKKLRTLINKKISSSDIKVTIPSQIHPFFKVRDYGVGLSPERVDQVFVNYCESTKDDSDVETGGFGIGAKSGWAYTDHFTVVSYYEGRKYTYSAHTEQEAGVLDLDSETDTTEANGVEIIISVNPKDIEAFRKAILRICFFWETRPNFVGLTPADLPVWFSQKANCVFGPWSYFGTSWTEQVQSQRIFSEDTNSLVLVLDGVPYSEPLTSTLANELRPISNRYLVALEAELGSCDVIASREGLAKTPKTLAFLQKISILPLFKQKLTSLYKEGKNIKEQMNILANFSTLFGKNFLSEPIKCQEWVTKGELFNYYPSMMSWKSKMHFQLHSAKTAVIHPITVKLNRYGDELVTVDPSSMRPEVEITSNLSIPVLLQDEPLSAANRRLKLLSFYKKTKIKEFLLFDITESPVAVEQFNTLFDTYQTSHFEITAKERSKTTRAKGVYTLYKISFNYGGTPRDKFQKEPEFFDALTLEKFILLTEEELKAINYEQREELKNFQNLKCKFFIAAPTTIEKLEGKKNIFTFKQFLSAVEKNYTLEERDYAPLYGHYHKDLKDILVHFKIFLKSPNKDKILKTLKDKKLSQAMDKTSDFLKMIEMTQTTNLSIPFIEKYFPKKAQEVRNSDTKKLLAVYQTSLKEYPLIRVTTSCDFSEELVTYINAKA